MTRPAPQLVFDDGSRVMHEAQSSSTDVTRNNDDATTAVLRPSRQRRQDSGLSLTEFYEIDRLVYTIRHYFRKRISSSSSSSNPPSILRIALQFPDELLCDAPMVCWEMEQRFGDPPASAETATTITVASDSEKNAASFLTRQVLVFCLGDTTYADCCPDFVAAAHLQADCIVHYGHACLSSSSIASTTKEKESHDRIPVFYSFGRAPLDCDTCVSRIVDQVKRHEHAPMRRLLLLYQVCYHHAMEELQTRLSEQGDLLVIAGQISDMNDTTTMTGTAADLSLVTSNTGSILRPEGAEEEKHHCSCGHQRSLDACKQRTNFSTSDDNEAAATSTQDTNQTADHEPKNSDEDRRPKQHLIVGGLELPSHLDWSTFTLLYIGDDSSRQYLNIVLRFLSSASDGSPQQYWTYDPITNELRTSLSATFQRKLQRRFYLVQKARQASILGILIANVSSPHSRTVATTLRDLIHDHKRSSYTFCVGKINPAKLANFPEVDAFVLVACPEHALLDNDSEYPVPVLTPLELTMALSVTEWGEQDYSLDAQDFVKLVRAVARDGKNGEKHEGNEEEDDNSDAPFYSLVTGRYEAAPKSRESLPKSVDLTALPGQGQLTTYNSAAAEFFKQREYQGLQVQAGATDVQVAQPGQQGIASNYGER